MKSSNAFFPKRPDWAAIILAVLAALWLLLCVTSCTTQRKAAKYFDNHGFEGAEYCATRYPVDSFFREGKPIITSDTQYFPITQTISNIEWVGEKPKDLADAKLSGTLKVITNTIYIRDTIGMVDKAKYKALQGKLIATNARIKQQDNEIILLKSDRERFKKGRGHWRLYALITWGILVAFGAGWFISKSKLL